MTEPFVKVTQVSVNCIPEANVNHYHYEIRVEYRGDGKWAVIRMGYCLGADGKWDYEPRPSSREDDWLATHRFGYETALELAKAAAPHIVVNGHTVASTLEDDE